MAIQRKTTQYDFEQMDLSGLKSEFEQLKG